jgi:hypothetical protein
MKIIFTGGRDYYNAKPVIEQLKLLDVYRDTIVCGGASGLDSVAYLIARGMGFATEVYPANWREHGRAAGPIRNRQMAELDDVFKVIAFPGGRGTANMVKTADARAIPVVIINES